jgi:general secretion pathway protein M
MKNILAGLDARQRSLVVSGVTILGILMIALIWGSLLNDVERLNSIVTEQQKLEQWMQQASREALQLRGVTSGNSALTGNKSLLALVDETAKQSRLGQAMKRVEPEGQDKVRIQLDGAVFDDMAQWLEKLELSYNVRVERISVDKLDHPGYVNARVTLAGVAG